MVILDFLFNSIILQKNICLHSDINFKHLEVTPKLKVFDGSNTFEPKQFFYYSAVFVQLKKGLSIITSKSSSKNISNENKQWCFVAFKTKHVLKCQFSGNTSQLLRFFDEVCDVIFDDPFLMLQKYCASDNDFLSVIVDADPSGNTCHKVRIF